MNLNQPYICMDLDGVVYPFVKAWHRMAACAGIIPETAAHTPSVPKWKFYDQYGLTGAEFAQTLDDWADLLYVHAEPIGETVRHWNDIYNSSFLHVITARPDSAFNATIDWLRLWGLKYNSLSVIGNGTDKSTCIDNPYARPVIAVEDSPDKLHQYLAAGVGTNLLVRREYNRGAWFNFTNISSIETVKHYMETVKHD